jgi:CrcB protein
VLGALARAGLGELLSAHPGRWPWATFIVNMAGATLLGYAIARLSLHTRPSPRVRAFVAGGVCGTLTTFSAMMLELLRMLDAGRVGLAFGYATASVCGALALVLVAGAAARRHVAVDAS